MDGAGRIARSIRSLRPKADLKAAAIGAAILLRAHVLAALRPARARSIGLFERRPSRRPAPAIYGAGRIVRSLKPQADLRAAAIGAAILLREHVLAALKPSPRQAPRRSPDPIRRALPRRWAPVIHGAGRIVRWLRPGADLKAAAIGVAILLRRHVLAPRRPRPLVARQPSPRLITAIERHLPRRAGVAATAALLLASAGFGVVRGGHVREVSQALDDTRNALGNAAGFRISAVVVSGRKQLTQDDVLAIGGVDGRSSLLFLDAAALRDRLKADPWIADATVLKLYPGRLQIDLVERSPFALWQQDGRLSVIADDGVVLEPYVSRRFLSLPLVVGTGAEKNARDFLELLARYPQVHALTRAAIFVGERRWNLRLKDGLAIRLPEHDAGDALAELSRLDSEDGLFSRDILAVDMRLPGRVTVQLSDDAAKAREKQFEDKKPKKKAGDA